MLDYRRVLLVSAMGYMCLSPITRYGMLPIGFTKMAVHVKDTEHPKLLKPGYHSSLEVLHLSLCSTGFFQGTLR